MKVENWDEIKYSGNMTQIVKKKRKENAKYGSTCKKLKVKNGK